MRVFKRLSLSFFPFIVIMGCSDSQTSITFDPENNETRSYRIYSDVSIESKSFDLNSDRILTTMLTEYRVEKTGDTWAVHIQPNYVRMKNRHDEFVSFDEPDTFNRDLHSLMSEGVELQLDENRKPTKFIINAATDDLDTVQRDVLEPMFKQEFSTPGFTHDLALQEGESMVIPGEGKMPAMELRVQSLTENHAKITLEGDNGNIKIFGLMFVEPNSGWLERGTVITSIEKDTDEISATIRSRMSVFPDDWHYDIDQSYLEDFEPFEMFEDFGFTQTADEIDADKVFANADGLIKIYDNKYYLELEHEDLHPNKVGKIEFRDAQPYRIDGESLDLELHLTETSTFNVSFSDEIETLSMAAAIPLGWNKAYQALAELGYIEATVSWRPYTSELVSLDVSSEPTSVAVGDARATLTPTGNDGTYELLMAAGVSTHFDSQVGTDAPTYFGPKAYAGAPDWVGLGDRRVLAITKYGRYPSNIRIDFGDDKPASIELLALTASAEAKEQRRIRFYNPDAVDQNPRAAAPQQSMLYPSTQDLALHRHDSTDAELLPFSARNWDAIDFEPFSDTRLFMTLTPEQAGLCRLEYSDADVVLQEAPEAGESRLYPHRLNDPVVMQARTPDGRRQHFYDHEFLVMVECPKNYTWKALDYEDSGYPWLIDVGELPGVTPDMPLARLLRTFAFLPEQRDGLPMTSEQVRSRSLGLVAPPSASDDTSKDTRYPYFGRTVGDYLYEGTYLRAAGVVSHIMHLTGSDDVYQYELMHQFPTLPDLSTTFAEIKESMEAK
ncbi:hypothetical protein QC820_16225 [Halomonas mongoliensis]|uniref:Lipoprotein n=1 Tax=Halomonas mongoliensis TaxID=321265 RepID=A0ABU1GQP2_9GAMM|nr:hypothetical protein [Halomonas mongoliensis]MDR5894338.1 hypothetical protein [Halomonas mongoliensis]